MSMRLFAKRVDVFVYFRDAAASAALAAGLLKDLFSGQTDLVQTAEQLRDVAHQGNGGVHAILLAQNHHRFASIDNRDIRNLARQLDDFLDQIDATGQRLVLYQLLPTPEPAQQLAGIINTQADLLVAAVAILEHKDRDDELARHIEDLRRLKHEADRVLHEALLSLYDDITEIPTFARAKRWEELYRMLEEAIDRAEKVTNIFQDIMEERQ